MPPQQKQPDPPTGEVAALKAESEQLKARIRVLEAKLQSADAATADITPEKPSFGESEGDRVDREQREYAEKVKAEKAAAKAKASE
jgi:hypothetical protein